MYMFHGHRLARNGLGQFPVFDMEGQYKVTTGIVPVTANALPIPGSTVPYDETEGGGPPVTFTGSVEADEATENGTGVASPTGGGMLTWLVVGGVALFALFGKNILKAR